jgi:hypothetical protein
LAMYNMHFFTLTKWTLEGYGYNTWAVTFFSPQNLVTEILKGTSFICDFESKFKCFLHLKYDLLHNIWLDLMLYYW